MSFLDVIVRIVIVSRLCFCSTADFSSQGFFQTNKVLSLALDSTSEFSSDVFPALGLDEGRIPASPVRFEPPYLDFKEHPVGQPHLEQVTLINGQEKKSLQLLSISATTPHFHCSFFQRKVVPAGENTTFDVVFLPREIGSAENTLFIRTSTGTYRYQLFGIGVTSPYRVQPWLGARIPVNGSFSPYLHLHNPHNKPLQITEMFTSGPDLHLELPPHAAGARHLWEIPPYETRTVMRLRLIGRAAANHTAFVQVKLTNHSGSLFGLVLPVEVEVSGQPGLYTSIDRMDFGLLRTLDSERTLTLQVTSLDSQPVLVTNVSLDYPNDAVRIDFHQTRVLPGAWRLTPLADVTFTAHRAQASRQWSGHVIVTGSGQRELLRVPYKAAVLQGALVYDANSTRFLLAPSPSSSTTRPIGISNTFSHPVVIFNASLPSDQLDVSLENFRLPVVIPAGATRAPFSLRVRAGATPRVLQLAIYSNASHFLIPVFLYTGGLRLVPQWPEPRSDGVDFGSLGPGERRRVEVALRNENPVEVRLLGLESDQPGLLRPQLLRVRRLDGSPVPAGGGGAAAAATTETAEPEIEMPLTLRPFHQVDIALNAVGPSRPGPQPGELLVRASPADLRLRWQMRGAEGSLSAAPDPFQLTDCFPGRVTCRWLSVRSSFHQLVTLRGVTFMPRDERFKFAPSGLPHLLKPFETTTVGKICFDHQQVCGGDCYAGFSLSTATGQEWLSGLSLDSRVADVDQLYLGRLAQRWDALARSDRLVANATVAMETAHAGGFLMRAQAQLARPGLLPAGWRLQMPLTHVGNVSELELLVNNPSDSPVLAQLLPMSLYPAPQAALSLLATRLGQAAWEASAASAAASASATVTLSGIGAQSEVARVHRDQLRALFGARVHPDSLATLIPARRRARFRLTFRPDCAGQHGAVFLLRNNLTGLEALLVTGEAAEPLLRVLEPVAGAPLVFQPSPELHHQLHSQQQRPAAAASAGVRPCGPMRRHVTVSNPGLLALRLVGYSLGEFQDCAEAGFALAACEPVTLGPNETRRIEVTFQPDYGMHRTARLLTMRPSAGPPLTVQLQASMPAQMLAACLARLPRPDWERQLQTAVTLALLICSLCALASAYCESDRLLALDAFMRFRQQGAPFDLRLLAAAAELRDSVPLAAPLPPPLPLPLPAPCAPSRAGRLFWRLCGSALSLRKSSAPGKSNAQAASIACTSASASAASQTSALLSATRLPSGYSNNSSSSSQTVQPTAASSSGHSNLIHHLQQQQIQPRRAKRQLVASLGGGGGGGGGSGKESRSASSASAASSAIPAAAASSSASAAAAARRPDPQLLQTPQFEPIDFPDSRKGKSRGFGKKQRAPGCGASEQSSLPVAVASPHPTSAVPPAAVPPAQNHHQLANNHHQQQHHYHQGQQPQANHLATKPRGQSCTPDAEDAMSQASETSSSEERRSNSGSIGGEKAPPPLPPLPPMPKQPRSSATQTAAAMAADKGPGGVSHPGESATAAPSAPRADEDEVGAKSRGRRRGGGTVAGGGGVGRVKSRSTATNTPNPIVRPSDLQPLLPSIPAKAAPLQPAQVLKQPKTSIVKPMTHQKPKRGFEDVCSDNMEKEVIQWDVPVSHIFKEDLEDIARRSQMLLMPPQKADASTPGGSAPASVSVAAVAPTTQLPTPMPQPPPLTSQVTPLPLPLLESAWHINPWLPPPPPQQLQQQLPPPLLPPTAMTMSELQKVTLQKTQSLFSYEEQVRRQQQQQQQQQQLQQRQQQSVWYSDSLGLGGGSGVSGGALDTSWTESTVSNRNLWGGFVDDASGAPAAAAGGSAPPTAGSADDPVARMLLGEPFLWASSEPGYPQQSQQQQFRNSAWAFYQQDATGDRK